MKILFAANVSPDPNSGAAGTEFQTIAGLRRLRHEVDEIWAEELGRRIKMVIYTIFWRYNFDGM